MKIKIQILIFLVLPSLLFPQRVLHKKLHESSNPPEVFHVRGSKEDTKFVALKNMTSHRRYSLSGRNEKLDIIFYLHNKTPKPREMKLLLFGFYQNDLSRSEYRKYVQYPEWRKRDFDAEQTFIYYLDSTPRISPKNVFQFIEQNKLIPYSLEFRFQPDLENIQPDEHPTLIDYVHYSQFIVAKEGIPFTLGTASGQEVKNELDYTVAIDRCRFIHDVRRSSISCELHSEQRINTNKKKDFFTHFCLFLYDKQEDDIPYRKCFKFTKEHFRN